MAEPTVVRLVLTGPREGNTEVLQGKQFVKGVLQLRGTLEELQGLVTYMGRSYGAYLEGSEELAKAQAKYKKGGEDASKVSEETKQGGSEEVSGDNTDNGDGITETSPDDSNGTTGSEEGDTGILSNGDGHTDTGVHTGEDEINERLVSAVTSLDPLNDEHWTSEGLPRMDAIEAVYGSAGVTRKLVEVSVPGYTREVAAARLSS